MMKLVVLSLSGLALTSACSEPRPADPDAAPPPPSVTDDSPVPDETVFTEIGVWRAADGTFQRSERSITAGEERRQNEARARAAQSGRAERIALDTGCAGDAAWLYDRNDFTGNRICFHGTGFVDLTGYKRMVCTINWTCFSLNWRLAAGSVWGGDEEGRLEWSDYPYPVDAGLGPDPTAVPFHGKQKVPFNVQPSSIHYLVLGQRCDACQ
jgi:hypothetical protein